MKRRIFILVIFFAVLGAMIVASPKPFTAVFSAFPSDAAVSVYCRETSCDYTDMGNGCLVNCVLSEINNTLLHCSNVDGISVRYHATENELTHLEQLFNVHITSVQQLENLKVVSGYSDVISGGLSVDGQKVNIQLAFDGEVLTIGSPLILDSY